MQYVIWTGVVVLGLITLSTAGIIFFHLFGEFRRGVLGKKVEPTRPMPSQRLRKVDLSAMRDDRPPIRRAA
jgi:hypothetical protein